MKNRPIAKRRDRHRRRARFQRAAWRLAGHAAVLCTIVSCFAPLVARR